MAWLFEEGTRLSAIADTKFDALERNLIAYTQRATFDSDSQADQVEKRFGALLLRTADAILMREHEI